MGEKTEVDKQEEAFFTANPQAIKVATYTIEGNRWAIFRHRSIPGVFVTGSALQWASGWKYEDYGTPQLENIFLLTEIEYKKIQDFVGTEVSKKIDTVKIVGYTPVTEQGGE